MPFRHLLYNRQNGAPQRPPTSQQGSDQYFPHASELNQYQWSEMDFQPYQNQQHNPHAMNAEQAYPSKRQALNLDTAQNHPVNFFTPATFPTSPNQPFIMSSDGFYRANSFNYSDVMDADVSSVSQGSIYSAMTSTSRVDGMLDEESFSLHSNSRKPSTSEVEVPAEGELLCPLLSGQTGKCSPSRCGPNAPCLNFAALAPIEECRATQSIARPPEPPTPARLNSSLSPQLEHLTSQTQRPRPRRQRSTTIKEAENSGSPRDQKKTRARAAQRSASRTKSTASSETSDLTAEQSNKVRARQAHSLVERKYRENLNAKIQLLHQTLQQTEFGPKNAAMRTSNDETLDDDEEEDEEMDEKPTNTGKVKKSDVLTEALSYVNSTEVEMRHMTDEIRRLNTRIHELEKLAHCEDCNLMKHMNTLKVRNAGKGK